MKKKGRGSKGKGKKRKREKKIKESVCFVDFVVGFLVLSLL